MVRRGERRVRRRVWVRTRRRRGGLEGGGMGSWRGEGSGVARKRRKRMNLVGKSAFIAYLSSITPSKLNSPQSNLTQSHTIPPKHKPKKKGQKIKDEKTKHTFPKNKSTEHQSAQYQAAPQTPQTPSSNDNKQYRVEKWAALR